MTPIPTADRGVKPDQALCCEPYSGLKVAACVGVCVLRCIQSGAAAIGSFRGGLEA